MKMLMGIVLVSSLFCGVGVVEYEEPKQEEKDLQVWAVKCRDKNGNDREEVYISAERKCLKYEISLCEKMLY